MRLGNAVARCERCDGSEFVHLDPGTELDGFSQLLCGCCETPATYGDLIVRIAGEGLREAGERLRSEE